GKCQVGQRKCAEEYCQCACATSPQSSRTSPGHVLGLLRTTGPLTRLELRERTGLSRVTLVERLEALRISDSFAKRGTRNQAVDGVPKCSR
ncbi:hypothetical protein, partial [Nocardia gipuzkoensis]